MKNCICKLSHGFLINKRVGHDEMGQFQTLYLNPLKEFSQGTCLLVSLVVEGDIKRVHSGKFSCSRMLKHKSFCFYFK